jgi:hypothetical protein
MKRWMIGMTLVGAMVGGARAQDSAPPLRIQSTLAPAKTGGTLMIAGKTGTAKTPTKRETYLGTTTSAASTAMREQLKLAKGVGLVVDSVEAKSPAEVAGIKQHDVLEKLNDQWLVNVEQFGALLRSMTGGDEVTLSLIRQGERQEIKAKLSEHEEKGGVANLIWMTPPDPALEWNPATGAAAAPRAPWALTKRADTIVRGNVIVQNVNGKQTTEWTDDQVRISLERDGEKTTRVTMKDAKSGKVLFDGAPPVEGDPFLKARPELGEKLKKAEEASVAHPIQLIVADEGHGGFGQVIIGGNGDAGMGVMGGGGGGGGGGSRGKVVRWQDDDHILIMRMMGAKPLYLLALSTKDGRTIYDGAVMTDEQRQSVPTEVAESLEMVVQHPETAKEFGAETKK